jgi:formylglycine-generating enzyme required for sulfatase activity
MEFVLISSGSFMMGSAQSLDHATAPNETPRHRVTISSPFFLGKYEVTQAQWESVMGINPSEFKGLDNPVESVSWDDAQIFIRRLNKMEGHGRYRLPTEAEWEYAARAGSISVYSFGDDARQLPLYGWYDANSSRSTHPVGKKKPNGWGLFDVHGNVWEWVNDKVDVSGNPYSIDPVKDPVGQPSGSSRFIRGGGWTKHAGWCRSADRGSSFHKDRSNAIGIRLALNPE